MTPPQIPPINALLDTLNVRFVSQLSLAKPPNARNCARFAAAGGTLLKHCTEKFAGHVIEGAVVSLTVIICVHEVEFVQSSVTV